MDNKEMKEKPWNFTTAKPGDLPEPKAWKMGLSFDGADERFELTDAQKEKARTALKEDVKELERLWLKVFGEPLNLPYIL